MLQHEDNFHDDVKLVIVYSFLTRLMLKNLQRSPIGKARFPALLQTAFSWYSQSRQKESLFIKNFPKVEDFVKVHLTLADEFESEFINSLADITYYLATHAKEPVVHVTVAAVTSPTYLKGLLKEAWNGTTTHTDFESWYKDTYT